MLISTIIHLAGRWLGSKENNMLVAANATPTLVDRIWPGNPSSGFVRTPALIVIGVFLLTASAHVQVPFWPVKMSMQTFTVLCLGVSYGSRLGSATVLAYLALGIAGAPVFVGGGGAAYFGGPTTGYLLGFLVATWTLGRSSEKGLLKNTRSTFAYLLLADAIIMAFGVAWLATLIGMERALHLGFAIFLPAEGLKLVLATAITRVSQRAL